MQKTILLLLISFCLWIQGQEKRRLFIQELKVSRYKSNGKSWDFGRKSKAPDIYMKIFVYRNGKWRLRFSSGVYKDRYDIPNQINTKIDVIEGEKLRIEVFDKDSWKDDRIGIFHLKVNGEYFENSKVQKKSFESVSSLAFVFSPYKSLAEHKKALEEKEQDLEEQEEKIEERMELLKRFRREFAKKREEMVKTFEIRRKELKKKNEAAYAKLESALKRWEIEKKIFSNHIKEKQKELQMVRKRLEITKEKMLAAYNAWKEEKALWLKKQEKEKEVSMQAKKELLLLKEKNRKLLLSLEEWKKKAREQKTRMTEPKAVDPAIRTQEVFQPKEVNLPQGMKSHIVAITLNRSWKTKADSLKKVSRSIYLSQPSILIRLFAQIPKNSIAYGKFKIAQFVDNKNQALLPQSPYQFNRYQKFSTYDLKKVQAGKGYIFFLNLKAPSQKASQLYLQGSFDLKTAEGEKKLELANYTELKTKEHQIKEIPGLEMKFLKNSRPRSINFKLKGDPLKIKDVYVKTKGKLIKSSSRSTFTSRNYISTSFWFSKNIPADATIVISYHENLKTQKIIIDERKVAIP